MLGESVKENHTILGIHLDGNQMTIDELGFIHPILDNNTINKDNDQNDIANSQIYYKIDEEHPLIKSKIPNVRKIRAKNNCWICEGWRELYFNQKNDINKYDTDKKAQGELHLNFEKYKGYEMMQNEEDYIAYRMCPPGEILYYYTNNGEIISNYGKHTHKLKEDISYVNYNETITDDFGNNSTVYGNNMTSYGNLTTYGNNTNYNNSHGNLTAYANNTNSFGNLFNNTVSNNLNTLNTISSVHDETLNTERGVSIQKIGVVGKIMNEINEHVITDEYRSLLKHCEPRPRKDKKIEIKPRTPWSFPISIWNTYFEYNYEGETEV